MLARKFDKTPRRGRYAKWAGSCRPHKNLCHSTAIREHVSLRQKLLVLPGITLLGLASLQATNSYVSSAISRQVVFPNVQELLTRDVQVSLKALVDTEASALGRRVASLNAPEQKVAAIIAETDPLRFFDDRSGYYFAYHLDGVRVNGPINKRDNGKNLIGLRDSNGVPFVQLNDATWASRGAASSTTHSRKPARAFNPKSRMSR